MQCRRLVFAPFVMGLTVMMSSLNAQAQEKATQVTFDHAGGGDTASHHLELRHGEAFTVVVTNTATNCFGFEIETVEKIRPQRGTGVGEKERQIRIVHEKQYGGYIIHIRRLVGAPDVCDSEEEVKNGVAVSDLPNSATIIVTVETADFEVAFAGGFTVSGLTNPVFALRSEGSKKNIIRQDTDNNDDVDLGVAAFVHAYDRAWHRGWPALTFGIGVGDSRRTTYHFGPFWRLGRETFVGGGVTFGPKNRLPAGVRVGDSITDANKLNNLGSRTGTGWFFSITYTFLGGRDALEKPFKSIAQGAAAALDNASVGTSGGNSRSRSACSQQTVGVNLTSPLENERSEDGLVKFTGSIKCDPTGKQKLRITVLDEKNKEMVILKPNLTDGTFDLETSTSLATGNYTAKFEIVGGETILPITEHNVSVQ